MSLTDFAAENCVIQSFGLLLSSLYWASLTWVSTPSSMWIHRDVRWLSEFRGCLALESCAANTVDTRGLAYGRRLVTQKGERRGISIRHKPEGILKLIRQMSLISQTAWSSHMITTEKRFCSVRFTEKSRHWTWLIDFVNLTDESVEWHLIRFSVTNTNCFSQQLEMSFRIINRPSKGSSLSGKGLSVWLSKR
jgi:hypothetical protein